MSLRKRFLAITLLSMGFAAPAAFADSISCILPEDAQVVNCLNTQVLPELIGAADKTFREYYRRLSQGYDLPIQAGDLELFRDKYFPEAGYSAIEVVGERIDGSGKNFSIRRDSYFLSAKRKKEKILKANMQETLHFVAYFHARNFGRKNGFLFNFNRVEISALNSKSDEGLLALDGQTLRVNLPEDRTVMAKDLLQMWNSGDVLLTPVQARTPRSVIKIFAYFGSASDKAGVGILENWKLFNPISDFRVQLTALYLKHATTLVSKLQNLPESSLRSWLEGLLPGMPIPEERGDLKGLLVTSLSDSNNYAAALDSLFSEKRGAGSGDISVINRQVGICLVKVSNSHVIKVDWDESDFSEGASKDTKSSVIIKDAEVAVTAASHQDIHVVNDKTWVGGVCVDTNDNVQVNMDSILRMIKKKMTDKALVKAALQKLI